MKSPRISVPGVVASTRLLCSVKSLWRAPVPWRHIGRLAIVSLVVVWLGRESVTPASASTSFVVSSSVALSTNATGANPDMTVNLSLPAPAAFFSDIYMLTPGTVATGPEFITTLVPGLGDIVGSLNLTANVGLTNSPCSNLITVNFTLLNATRNAGRFIVPSQPSESAAPENRLYPLVQDANTVWPGVGSGGPGSTTSPANGLPAGVDLYPMFLKQLTGVDDPVARYFGAQNVAGMYMTVNILVLDTGTANFAQAFAPPHPLADLKDSGYVSVLILNDPTHSFEPGSVTDICTPTTMTKILHGVALTNPCAGNTGAQCDSIGEILAPSPGVSTGRVRYTSPAVAGSQWYSIFAQSQRDTDNDGNDNTLDPCPVDVDSLNPRLPGGDPANDTDLDRIPNVCDQINNPGNSNQDGDTAANGREWLNAEDYCPQIASTSNVESENFENATPDSQARPRGGPKYDAIGNACDISETACAGANDDDADKLVNDGCPPVGAPEIGCLNKQDDDGDGTINDGCVSSSRVATGHFHTIFNRNAVCIGGADDDGDGWCTADEGIVGSNPNNGTSVPEHYALQHQFFVAPSGSGFTPPASREPVGVCMDGIDNDGDTFIDLFEPDGPDAAFLGDCDPIGVNFPSVDTDGDGYDDVDEMYLGTDALSRCGIGAEPAGTPSSSWPSDLASGGIPNSTDKITIADLVSFLAPIYHLYTSPGDAGFDQRWNLVPGKGPVFPDWIVVVDLVAMLAGPTGYPPMFGGAREFGGPACTAHPLYGD